MEFAFLIRSQDDKGDKVMGDLLKKALSLIDALLKRSFLLSSDVIRWLSWEMEGKVNFENNCAAK